MFSVLCEEWKRRLLLFFGCGAPFLADVSYSLTFEFRDARGRKGGENLRAENVKKWMKSDRRALNLKRGVVA